MGNILESPNIKDAVAALRTSINTSNSEFDRWIASGKEDFFNPDWTIETCYLKLLAIVECLGLNKLHEMILEEYSSKKTEKNGFSTVGLTSVGEEYSKDCSRLRQLIQAVNQFYPSPESTTITKDILQILRDIHYTVTDKNLFVKVPQNEQDIHVRIEGILKCVFPDLKHKPILTKPIKNFEPDTGIPSIRTLIEYKFLSRKGNVKSIADEVLADTRGYTSRDWNHFIYVIYETNRFRPEKEWVQLLRESGIPENTNIVVLSGEPPIKRKKKASEISVKKL